MHRTQGRFDKEFVDIATRDSPAADAWTITVGNTVFFGDALLKFQERLRTAKV